METIKQPNPSNNTTDYWFQSFVLFGVLALMVFLYGKTPDQQAMAAGGSWDTDGIMAMATNPSQRMVIIDTKKQNICVYRILGVSNFKLVGARSYKYDVELRNTKGTKIEKGNGITALEAKQIFDQIEAANR